ncbi:MAG TPA: hypothetical protein VI461_06510 [Chitinophagaceae bacterium]|nr:hypothetical protein [Chitinophagaceae bacterium]
MEHGIGDYFYVMNEQHPKSKMFAVFANGYKNYLLNKRIKSDWVYEITGLSDFHLLAQHLIKKHNRTLCLFEIPAISKPIVFILLEAVDMYNVPESFWTDYLDHILEQLDSPQRFHFLLKTHPVQSKISVVISEFFFQDKNLEYTLLADDKLSSASAEVLFNLWFPNTEHVFCLFSSGCFYLSQLYKDKPITFWYSTEFFSRYIKNAPPQYKIHFEEIRPLIEQVFAERCKSY